MLRLEVRLQTLESEGDPYKRTRLFKNKESFLCYSCNLIKSRLQFGGVSQLRCAWSLFQKNCKSFNALKRALRMVNFSMLTRAISLTYGRFLQMETLQLLTESNWDSKHSATQLLCSKSFCSCFWCFSRCAVVVIVIIVIVGVEVTTAFWID